MNAIPLKVYNENGCVNTNIDKVLHTWKEEFKALFNKTDNIQYDNEFFEECIYCHQYGLKL